MRRDSHVAFFGADDEGPTHVAVCHQAAPNRRECGATSVLRSKTLARAESARAGQVPKEIPLRKQGGELHPRTVGNAEF